MPDLTRAERDALIRTWRTTWQELHPDDGGDGVQGFARAVVRERHEAAAAEYADRLPRVPMGACPFTGALVRRLLDPFGLDGPFWHADPAIALPDPPPPAHFRCIHGALDLRGRVPAEATDEVLPGPAVPVVIPNLLALPGMVAVIAALDLPDGSRAYPVTYWSTAEMPAAHLHTPWLRSTYWLPDGGWMICNAVWDPDLGPWVDRGQVRWIAPGDPAWSVRTGRAGCPYLDLPGHRGVQRLADGALEQEDPPDGQIVDPFAD
jgi:hypothetical protein